MRKSFSLFVGLFLMIVSPYGATDPACADHDLRERAEAFWNARVREDGAVLYQYLPGENRDRVSLEAFSAAGGRTAPFRYESFEVRGAETAGELGWVKVVYTAKVPDFPEVPSRRIEIWQVWERTDGNWRPVAFSRTREVPALPPGQRPAEEEAELKKRVHELWEAMEKEQWGLIHSYCDPEFKKAVPKEEFLQKRALYLYLSHEVEWVEVSGDRGRAKVAYRFRPSDPYLARLAPADETILEDWIKYNGKWYRLIPQ